MPKLDDFFENSTPGEGIEVDFEVNCDECYESAEKVIYNKHKKQIYTLCANGHEITLDIDLSWLVN